ncbi:MAG: ABC transporter transmembrane domain-containing protein [Steroidobacteraceae bacterium]
MTSRPGPPAWVRRYVRGQARTLAAVAVLSALLSVLAVAQPWLSMHIVDDALIGRDLRLLVLLCAAIVGLAVLGLGLGALNRWLYVRASGRMLFALREDVYAHLLRLPPEFFRRRPVGEIVSRLDGDVAEIQRFASDTLLAVINSVLVLTVTAAVMLWLDPLLALVAAASLPVQLWLRRRAQPWIRDTTHEVRAQAGRVTQFLVETLGGVRAVQGAAAEDFERDRLATLNREYLARLLRQQVVGFSLGSASAVVGHLSTAAVFVVGGVGVIQGSTTVGTLVAFAAWLTRSAGSAASLLNVYSAWQRARVSLDRVEELRSAVAVATPGSRAVQGPGALRFENLVLRREPGAPALLDGVTIDLPAGCKIVLRGASGAGKSTLADVLRRFVEPEAGEVLLDGRALAAYDLQSLRRRVVVLDTEPVLLPGSIRHSLRYGHFGASDADVERAAAVAGVADFLRELPQGYETLVGGGGAGLSAGQRQRVALARALLADPVVVVVDEATSHVDAAGAGALLRAIDRCFGHCTRIVITHAAIPVDADIVLTLAAGRLRPSVAGATA